MPFLFYADTPTEFKDKLVEQLKVDEARERRNVAGYTTIKGRAAQEARANTYETIVMFLENTIIDSNQEEQKMKKRSQPAFKKE